MGDEKRQGLFVRAVNAPPQICYRDEQGTEWPVSPEMATAVALCELTDMVGALVDAVNGLDGGAGFKVSR